MIGTKSVKNENSSKTVNTQISFSLSYQPEVLRAQHLGVEHDFTLVRGHLQRGQHVVHSGQVGGRAGRHVVKPPLQDVEAGPPGYMRALRTGKSVTERN